MPSRTDQVSGAQLVLTQPERSRPLNSSAGFSAAGEEGFTTKAQRAQRQPPVIERAIILPSLRLRVFFVPFVPSWLTHPSPPRDGDLRRRQRSLLVARRRQVLARVERPLPRHTLSGVGRHPAH